uniref:CENP-V/GFA domain-containing protein n=1 Tax=Chromera velia CCMP2878 TaxID=1169474 RepID=A0A0G4I3F7_9ALVE|eukprot:Cvel_10607.t1-p1 / transcript=Cvel_10607.t1 / gene=Cvel_10607 / organism=Chromera_velia_CCMP2878 / gene_product=hypothetical protein / transcript_product=hypothetical protein / location=Cvel_scaffold643:68132-69160(-) / protein_length=220 / sequence_SO=supercontig / SO=protein_coding / is_pseudo=false
MSAKEELKEVGAPPEDKSTLSKPPLEVNESDPEEELFRLKPSEEVQIHKAGEPGDWARSPLTVSCLCKKVQYASTGSPPVFSGYCHCRDCRSSCNVPLCAFVVFKPGALELKKGEGTVKTYKVRPTRSNVFCGECGQQMFTKDKEGFECIPLALCLDEAGNLPKRLKPQGHQFYPQRVIGTWLEDKLVKYVDLPQIFGGTGNFCYLDADDKSPSPCWDMI